MVSTSEIFIAGLEHVDYDYWTANGKVIIDITANDVTGIDFQIDTKEKSFKYETQCYKYLLQTVTSSNAIIIGPHITDAILVAHSSWRRESRPDAIIFREDDVGWVLSGLGEFKSGKRFSKNSKLRGFERWLKRMRMDQNFIPRALGDILHSVGGHIRIPSNTYIPPNELLNVVFISPKKKFHYQGDTEFNLHHLYFEAS
ncbi:hypothetical protein ACFL1P_01015 [Patescibacteria group bacterium]